MAFCYILFIYLVHFSTNLNKLQIIYTLILNTLQKRKVKQRILITKGKVIVKFIVHMSN